MSGPVADGLTPVIEAAPHALQAGPALAGSSAAATAHAGEYLSFRLGTEEYGIDILRVQEIRSYEPPTRIANAPRFIKGVVNLRGVIVPIIDLRLKLDCESAGHDAFTVVIVLNVRGRVLGAVVDSVSDVLQLGAAQIRPAPPLAGTTASDHIIGIACVSQAEGSGTPDRMLQLIDIEAMMSASDMGLVNTLH